MLKLTVSLIACRVPWAGGRAFATASPLPRPAAQTPVRAGPARGPGEALSFLEREIEEMPAIEAEAAGPEPVDARGLRAWWRAPKA